MVLLIVAIVSEFLRYTTASLTARQNATGYDTLILNYLILLPILHQV